MNIKSNKGNFEKKKTYIDDMNKHHDININYISC